MPSAPLRYCAEPGCPEKTAQTRCAKHYQADRAYRNRFTEGKYGRRWRRAREAHLAAHPFCVWCLQENRSTLATDVDHIVPHRGDEDLMWNPDNYQSLCERHHGRKTAQEAWG